MADLSNNPISSSSTVEADSTSHSVDTTDDTGTHKKPKTYEKRKLSSNESSQNDILTITSSPCSDSSAATTSSPQNTSRYGRARKPKITEDFYNTEDIFGPYERIPCSPVRNFKKKLTTTTTTKLELSPSKSNEIVTLDVAEIIKPNLDAMLSIDIPDDTMEVSKVLKIVSNNTSDEFSPKSPSFSKPVKTYSGKREKKTSESIFGIESFGLPDYPAGENCPYVNGLSHSEDSSSSDSEKLKICDDNDVIINSNTNSEQIKRTKFNLLSLKKNTKSPVKNLIQSDNISTSTPAIIKSEINNKKLSNIKNKHRLKVSKIIKNKFRVQKKPLQVIRLKAKKMKALKSSVVSSAQKIHLGASENSDESSTDKKKFEAIADLHKIYMPEVGDLTWSRVGSFPFWPSIVTKEPNSDRHTRTINFGKRITHFYHVNFFGDNGRRSWVLQTHIFPFHQRSDLEIMAKSVSKDAKPKEPRHLSAYIINPTKLVKWETAVTEAESLSVFPKDKRIKKFFDMVSPKKKSSTSGKIPKKSQKHKHKKKKVPKYFNEKNYVSDMEIKEETKDESFDETNDNYGRNRRKSKKHRKPSIVSEDSYTDSEKMDALVKRELRDTPSPVLSSSARYKKINLFKGVSRERVCQICGKFKDVYRCKGQCNGYYHIECDRKQRLRLPATCDEKTDFETLIGENIVGKQIKQEAATCAGAVASSVLENLLANVFDCVLPGEPRKVMPSLSISEQIDLKMQEVMKNVVDANYNDSTTDYSSGSETESKTNSQNSEMSEKVDEACDDSKNTKGPKAKVIKHVTADGVFDVVQEEEIDEDLSNFKCTYCSTGYKPPCFICNKEKTKSGDVIKHKCMTTQCGKYYHAECLKDWPQTKWYLSTKRKEIDSENLTCPYHNCHTCISDDPRGPLSRMNHEKLAKCIRCPTTYHIKSHCIPAGTEILSNYQLICPKHLISTSKVKFMHHVNASWCFICSMGGSLICCETCPSSFHVECLKMTPPEGKYICEECESGRLPLYDEIVWVKLGSYRWWPAQILFPVEIPDNVKNIAHNKGEFVVRFFGSHDHYWVNRGRVFLFQEGDTGHASSKKSAADRLFVKAIEEATKAHQKFVEERTNRVEDSKNSMKPPSYIKIKANKPVGDVRITDADTSNTTPCDCDPNWDQPCGPDSDCLNRILLTECNPLVCAAGSRCCNQAFQNREYAHVEPFKTSARGWGLRTLSPVKKGTFVIEYVGEVINETEYMRRMKRKHEQKDENYYFLTIDKDRMIDAGPKGNAARFMNHSCSPNCETQKWTVNGDTRVGLFAIKDISEGAELTFNYNLECIGEEKKECRCGAPNCSGFIGVKAKQDEDKKKKKKTYKKKQQIQETKDFEVISCFVCGKTNAIQQCDREACNKFYHLECVNLETVQEGKWFCPWHSCNICTKRTIRCCYICINSYCPLHSEGYIRYDRVKGFICKEHDTPELNAINIELFNQEVARRSHKKKLKTIKPKSIAEQDLEEILKHDVTQTKSNTNDVLKSKKLRAINERSLANLKNYKGSLHLQKPASEDKKGEEKTATEVKQSKENNKAIKLESNQSNREKKSIPVEAPQVEKTNGLHPDIKLKDSVNKNEPPNQNNNLTIKKRKSRLNSESEDDDLPLSKRFMHEDDLPLSKRFKLDGEIQSITKNMTSDENMKKTVIKENEVIETSTKLIRSKSVLELTPQINKTKIKLNSPEKIHKNSKDKLDQEDSKENVIKVEEKKINTTTEVVVKRPRGRPRKYFPAPIKPPTNSEIKQKLINETTIDSSMDSSQSETQSQSSEEIESTDDDADYSKVSIPVDLECDAEEGIKKSVINKETLHVTSVNAEKSNLKQVKLISPRPGSRKSLRITDPFDTSSNVSNSELEISIELNSSQEFDINIPKMNSTLLEEKRGVGRPKLSTKKKGLIIPVRKSNRFSGINIEETIKEDVKEITKEKPNKIEDISISVSSTLDSTSSPGPGDEPQKRKRGRPRKYFNLPPVNVDIPPTPKRPKGRPRKIKPNEEPSSSATLSPQSTLSPKEQPPKVNVEETTESFKIKVNTEPSKPKTQFESHINEIKLTTNVPERHLRVMLRKSDIDSRAESKFLQMQNDIERDLPIRKRSKLRYETHL